MIRISAGNLIKTIGENLLTLIILFSVAILNLLQSPLAPFAGGEIFFDSGVFLYTGWKMSQGFLPYLHSWDNKGPLLYVINMLGIVINYDHGLWWIEVIFLFVSAVIMYKTFRLWASKAISIISVIYVLTTIGGLLRGGNFTEEYALPFSYLAIYLFSKYIFESYNFKFYHSILLGISFAATLLLRPNIASIWPVFCFIYFVDMLSKNKILSAARFVLFFVLGVILIFLPFACYLLTNDILNEFVNSVLFLPLCFNPTIQQRLIAVLQLIGELSVINGLFIIAVVVLIILVYKILFKKEPQLKGAKLLLISLFASFIFNVYANSLSGYSYAHYAITFVTILSLPVMFAFKGAYNWVKRRNPEKRKFFALIYISLILLIIIFPSILMQARVSKYSHNKQDPIQDYILLHTNDNSKIQVFSHKEELYYKTKRQSASKFSYIIINGSFEDKFEEHMLETIFDDIIMQKPAIIVFDMEHEKYINNLDFPISNKESFDIELEKEYILDHIIDEHKIYRRKP